MPWQAVSTSSILTVLSQAEYNKFTTLSTGSMYTAGTLLQEIINDAVAEVRGYCMGCPRNSVDSNAALVPPSLVNKTKQIVVYRLMSRVAGVSTDIDKSRITDYNRAIAYLEEVSNGKRGIEIPDNPVVPSAQFNTISGGFANDPIEY